MNLSNYIKENHKSNVSAFALTQGVRYDQVTRWIKRGCIIQDGVVYCQVSKQTNSDNKGESK